MISTPLIFPKVQPSNWQKWWELWFKESRYLVKTKKNFNDSQAPWWGLDLYVKKNVDSELYTKYKAPLISSNDLFLELINNLHMLPIDVDVVRAVSSQSKVNPHRDTESQSLSVRSLMYDNNVYPTFYYFKNNIKMYQFLPDDTNTWAYWDHKCLHGTDHYRGHSKILIMFYGNFKKDVDLTDHKTKYSNYIIR